MELRLTFNEDEVNYDTWRPSYLPGLFEEIIRYAGMDETKHALEIGIGTGQATLPFLQTGCRLTAIEIGERLAAYSGSKFAHLDNFEVIHIDFERFDAGCDIYDLIYAATAFHWMPEETGYTKAFALLKSGGTLALFWNHPFVCRTDDALHMEIRKVYNHFRPSDAQPVEFNKDTCPEIMQRIKQYGFTDCRSKLFYQTRTFTAEGYIALLNTYSDHRSLPADVKAGLENGIADAIDRFGGKLNIYDTMDLYLSRKP